jgi:hypothetical protein
VLQAANTRELGDYVRGYTAYFRTGDKPPTSKGREALMVVAFILAAAVPLALFVFVAWWAGIAALAAGAIAFTVWLRRPNKAVHEFRAGLVTVTKDGINSLRWDEIAAVYQQVNQIHVNGVYGGTNHQYRLPLLAGGHVTFGGSVNDNDPDKSDTSIDELGEAILREIPARHLRPALDTLNSGGEVRFDKITLTLAAIVTPAATTPWPEVRDLVAGGGQIALYTQAPKPWQLKIAEIPNFPVFWTLAQELRKPR